MEVEEGKKWTQEQLDEKKRHDEFCDLFGIPRQEDDAEQNPVQDDIILEASRADEESNNSEFDRSNLLLIPGAPEFD